jgi:hypothetical protein
MAAGQDGRFACIGLLDKFNSGGAVEEETIMDDGNRYEVHLRGSGQAGFFAAKRPSGVLIDDDPAEFEYDGATGLLRVQIHPNAWGGALVALIA